MGRPFGIALNPEATFFARLLGAAFLALAIMTWLGRGATDPDMQLATALPNLVVNGLAVVFHGADLARGGLHNNRAWGLVALIAALAVAWLLVGVL